MHHIDYPELFHQLDLDPTLHSGKMACPFCTKKAFTDYADGKAYCHACQWSGDAIQLYAAVKRIDRKEAYAALAELFEHGDIKPKRRTLHEVVESLSRDLEFLAWCRMYFAYHGNDRAGMSHYQSKTGLSRPQFSKVINGHFELVSPRSWNLVLTILRQDIDIKDFRRDLKEGKQPFERKVVDQGLLESAKRFL
jgi:hypothetical protein